MLGILQQINAVPGVLGSFVCDDYGKIHERAFPPLFEAPMLEEAAVAMADCAVAMEHSAGGLDLLDLRFNEFRVLIKSLSSSFIFLLCDKEINLPLLNMSLGVAARRLDRLEAMRHSARAGETDPSPSAQVPASGQPGTAGRGVIPVLGRGLGLTVHSQEKTASTFWSSMLEGVSMNRFTSVQLSDHYQHGRFKKVKLTNINTKASKKFPVTVISNDSEHLFDGKVVVTLAVLEALGVRQGDQVMAELDIGGGFLGWEGI